MPCFKHWAIQKHTSFIITTDGTRQTNKREKKIIAKLEKQKQWDKATPPFKCYKVYESNAQQLCFVMKARAHAALAFHNLFTLQRIQI